jgi:LL-diaminopimelate aminotransferase
VKAYGDVKDNTDSGQFLGIQNAVAYCFDHPEITERIATKYSRRMDGLVKVLNNAGFAARKPKGSFFLYVPSPKAATGPGGAKVSFANAEEFSQWMITENLISTVPWDDAGAFVRFSVTFQAKGEPAEQRVLAEIARRLGSWTFSF